MSISNLYSSESHKKDMGHFASIVKLAMADEVITEGEQKLLDRMAKDLNIMEHEYAEIIKNPNRHPINPPVSYDDRIERLYNLTRMIYADGEVSKNEVIILRKVAIGLGFPLDNVEKVSDEALHLIMNNNDLEDFTKAVKKVNNI